MWGPSSDIRFRPMTHSPKIAVPESPSTTEASETAPPVAGWPSL